jgi:hypothetical protein
MLFSLSMVNVFISVLSWHGVAVTSTFITPVGETGKRNLTESLGWRRGGDDAAEWDFGYGKAHVISSQAYTALKQPEKAQFHHNVAGGLLHSIFSTGDGNTKETAFEVIGTFEEHVVMAVMGLPPLGSQALIPGKPHSYDRLEVQDPKTGQKVSVYFNIDAFYPPKGL